MCIIILVLTGIIGGEGSSILPKSRPEGGIHSIGAASRGAEGVCMPHFDLWEKKDGNFHKSHNKSLDDYKESIQGTPCKG